MNEKDKTAIEEFRDFVNSNNKDIVAINEFKEYVKTEEKTKQINEIKNIVLNELKLPDIPNTKNITQEILKQIPKPKNGKDGKDGIGKIGKTGKNGIDGKDGVSLNFRGTLNQHPNKPVKGDCYRNDIHKLVYHFNGKKWDVLIKDGLVGMGIAGGGLGVRDVRTEINERAKDAYFDNSGTVLSATNINDAIIESSNIATSGINVVDSVFGRIGSILSSAGDYSDFYPSLLSFNTVSGDLDIHEADTTIHFETSALNPNIVSITSADSPYTVTSANDIILCNNVTIILPLASSRKLKINIKNNTSASNSVTVSGNGSELIDLENTQDINELEAIELISDLTQWWIL